MQNGASVASVFQWLMNRIAHDLKSYVIYTVHTVMYNDIWEEQLVNIHVSVFLDLFVAAQMTAYLIKKRIWPCPCDVFRSRCICSSRSRQA